MQAPPHAGRFAIAQPAPTAHAAAAFHLAGSISQGCPSAARTECRSGQPDRPPGSPALRRGGWGGRSGAIAARDRQGEAGEPYQPNAQPTQSCRSVRRSKGLATMFLPGPIADPRNGLPTTELGGRDDAGRRAPSGKRSSDDAALPAHRPPSILPRRRNAGILGGRGRIGRGGLPGRAAAPSAPRRYRHRRGGGACLPGLLRRRPTTRPAPALPRCPGASITAGAATACAGRSPMRAGTSSRAAPPGWGIWPRGAEGCLRAALGDQPAQEGGAFRELGGLDVLVGLVGAGDVAGADHHRGHVAETLEEAGLGAVRDLGVAVAAGEPLGDGDEGRVGAMSRPG